MRLLRSTKVFGTPSSYRRLYPSSYARFESSVPSNSDLPSRTRAATPLTYKGRIPKTAAKGESIPEPVVEALDDVGSGPALAPPKSEPTKEQKYKTAARRYTGVMIGAPIAIVTSYFLYRRLFLGDTQKKLVLINEATE